MSRTEQVIYEFMAKTDGAVDGIKRMQGAMSSLQNGMQAIGGLVAFEKITAGLAKMLTASSEAEVAQRRFYNTMVATGQAVDPDKFYELADALEKVTVYQADETVAAAAMMARFRLTQNQIEELIPSVMDLAASMGTDLASAADAVARATVVGSTGLRALNLGFTTSERAAFDAANTQGRLAIIMARVQGTIGGTAQLMAGTAVGAAKQYGVAWENMLQAFGKVLDKPVAAVLHKITDAVRSATDAFQRLNPHVQDVFAGIVLSGAGVGATAAAVAGLAGALGMVAEALPKIAAGFGIIRSTMAGVALSFAIFGMELVGALVITGAILVVIGALRRGWNEWGDTAVAAVKKVSTAITDFLISTMEKFTKKVEAFTDLFQETFINLKSWLDDVSPEEAYGINKEAQKGGGLLGGDENAPPSGLEKALTDFAKKSSDDASKYFSDLGSALKMVGGDLASFFKEMAKMPAEAWADANLGLQTIKDVLRAMGLDVDAMGASIDEFLGKYFKSLDKAPGSDQKKRDGTGAGGPDTVDKRLTVGELQSRKPFEASDALASKHAASSLSGDFGGGDAGAQAASDFLAQMARVYHLSEKVVEGIAVAADGSRVVIDEIASSMDGMGEDVSQRLLRLAKGNEGDLQRAAVAFRGFSDEAVASYEKLSGGDLDEMVRMGTEASAAWKASLDSIREAGANAKNAIDSGNGVPSGEAPKGSGSKDELTAGDLALNSVGNLLQGASLTGGQSYDKKVVDPGGVMGSAIQGGMMGGPMGAAAGAIVGLLQQTEGFQKIVSELGAILSPMVDALEPLLAALEPWLSLVQVAANIFVSLMKVLSPLVDLVRLLGHVMEGVSTAIAVIYNGVLEAIAGILDFIAWVLPDWLGGDVFEDAAKGTRNAKISTDYDAKSREVNAIEENTDATEDLTKAINQSVQNVPSGWVVAAAQYGSILGGLGDIGMTRSFELPGTRPGAPMVNVTVYANDAEEVYKKVKKAAALDNYQTTGSTVTNGMSPFGVPKSTAGYGR